jgi:hypothetical protein
LNFYVRCKQAPNSALPLDPKEMESEKWNLQSNNVIILTEASQETCVAVDEFCRSKGIKFISADCYGAFSRVFNDFGSKFEVLDKNGEET